MKGGERTVKFNRLLGMVATIAALALCGYGAGFSRNATGGGSEAGLVARWSPHAQRGQSAGWGGGVYENEAVKDNGVSHEHRFSL